MLASLTLDRSEVDSSTPCQDTALIARLRNQEESAYEELVRTYAPHMLSVARKYLKRQDDAEDAIQQSLLSAFSSLDRFAEKCSLGTWLHRIVVNACLMQMRRQQRRPTVLMDDLMPKFGEDGGHVQPICDWSQTALEQISTKETRALVRQALEEMPESYRHVIQLRDIEGFDTSTTADLLGVSDAVVKTRLHRARIALREILAVHFDER